MLCSRVEACASSWALPRLVVFFDLTLLLLRGRCAAAAPMGWAGVHMTPQHEVEASFLCGMCARCGALAGLAHLHRQVVFDLNSGRWWEEGSVSWRRERRGSTALDVLLRWTSGLERACNASWHAHVVFGLGGGDGGRRLLVERM